MHDVDSGTEGSRWDTGRTEAFSDSVFAFAITLLVLEIDVPESVFSHLWRGLADPWPSYLGYATSFITIGGIWLVHHGISRCVRYANRRVMTVNLALPMAVAFLPFPTKLVAEAIHNSSAERAAVIFYGASLLAISLLFSALWASVASRAQPAQTRGERERGQRNRTGDDTEDRLLRRRDRARVHRPKSGRVRIPGDRDRRRSASARRQRDTDDPRVCVTPACSRRPSAPHRSNTRRVPARPAAPMPRVSTARAPERRSSPSPDPRSRAPRPAALRLTF